MFNKFQDIYVMNRFGGGVGGGGFGGGGGGGGQATGGRRTFSYLAAPTSVSTSMGSSETMANGTSVNTWNFNNGGGFNGNRSVPGPVIEANQGSNVQVTLNSAMALPHTIHFHGLDVDQQNDGVPATSFSVSQGSYTYNFTAPHAGTYQYHCHVDTHQHYELGMFGTVIIRPSNGSTSRIWDSGPSFDKEYLWHLTTYDSPWHSAGGGNGPGGPGGPGAVADSLMRYNPDYFMINGKDGNNPHTDSATAITAAAGDRVLIRINGTSYMPGMVRMGGLPFEVVASDGRPLAQSYTATEQLCCAGERYDIILTMPSSGTYTGSIEYRNIRNNAVLGSATTTITVA